MTGGPKNADTPDGSAAVNDMFVVATSELRRPIGLGVVVVMVLMAAAICAAASAAVQAGGHCSPPVIVSRLPRDAVLDTTWHSWGPGLRGCRILNRTNAWAVNDNWFTISGHPKRFYRLTRLLELSDMGVLDDSTMLHSVQYRFVVKVAADSEARVVAKAKLPAHPPKAVQRELQRLEREYQQKLRKPVP